MGMIKMVGALVPVGVLTAAYFITRRDDRSRFERARDSVTGRASETGSATMDRLSSAGSALGGAISHAPGLLAAAPLISRFISEESGGTRRPSQGDWRDYPDQIGR